MDETIPRRAIITGAAAALAGGIVWALLAILIQMEIGWVAWGLGAFVGWMMLRQAGQASRALGTIAVVLAAIGLLAGKWLILAYGAVPAIAAEVREYGMEPAAYHEMITTRAFEPGLQSVVDSLGPDAILHEGYQERILAAIHDRIAGYDEVASEAAARAWAQEVFDAVPLTERIKASFSFYDLLWFGLALATAWRIAGGPAPAPVSVPEAADGEGPTGTD